jgi:prepilin peptidase CpaA
LWAAAGDARGMVLPNRAVIGIVVLFPFHILARMLAAGSVASTLIDGLSACAVAAVVLIAGFGFFAMHYIGGGDAKLAAATALWAGANNILLFVMMAGLAGGLLAAVVLLWRTVFPDAEAAGVRLRTRLYSGFAKPVPFGVAIAASGLMVAAKLAEL